MKNKRNRRIRQASAGILAAALLFSTAFCQAAMAEGDPVQSEPTTSVEPTSEPNTEPTTEPITEPTTEPITEPTTEPPTEPTTEPITEPTTEPITEPTTEPITEPITEPSTEPVTEPTTEPDTAVTDVQNLINALPTAETLAAMSAEEQQAAREKLDSVQQAYMVLSDEQKAQVTGTEIFDKLYKFFENMTAAANVQSLISELPSVETLTAMNEEEQQAVRGKLDAAHQAYMALTDEQKALVAGTDIFNNLYEFFNKVDNEAPADDDTLTQETLTTEGETEKVNCTCAIACTADAVNADCPVCNGDSSKCTGRMPEANTVLMNEEPDTAVTDVQALINALPTAEELKVMPLEEQQTVYTQLCDAYDAYETLTDEQKTEVTGAEIFDALFAVFNGMVNTLEGDFSYSDSGGTRTYTGGSGDSISISGMSDFILNVVFAVQDSLNVNGQIALNQVQSANFQSGTVSADSITFSDAGDVIISGGILEANSLKASSTWNNLTASISITGGIVKITGEISSSATGGNSSGRVTVNGDAVVFAQSIKQQSNGDSAALDVTSFDKGVVFIGNSGNVYGSVSLPDGVVIPDGYTLEIPAGSTLTIPAGVTLTNNGTITGAGNLTINGDVIGSGSQTVTGTVTKKSQTATVPTWDKANTTASKIALSNTVTGQKYLITDTASTPVIENYTWTDGTGGNLTFDELPDGNSLSGGSTYYVWTYLPGNNYYADSDVQSVTVTTVQSAPAASTVTINYAAETISFADATLEVNTSENFDGTSIANNGSITDYIKDTKNTIYVRVKGTGNTAASAATPVTIPARPAAPTSSEISIKRYNEWIQIWYDGKETVEFRGKINNGNFTEWQGSWSSVTSTFDMNKLHTSDVVTFEVRKAASNTEKKFCSEALTLTNLKPSEPVYEITIPKTVQVGETDYIKTGNINLGYEGLVTVSIADRCLESDGTITLTRENDPAKETLSVQMKANGSPISKDVCTFDNLNGIRASVPISFEVVTSDTIPAGSYRRTVTFELTYSETGGWTSP